MPNYGEPLCINPECYHNADTTSEYCHHCSGSNHQTIETEKENMRIFEWGLYSPDGLLFGVFRYEQDALSAVRGDMFVRQIEIEPIMHTCKDVKIRGDYVATYITLIASEKIFEDEL